MQSIWEYIVRSDQLPSFLDAYGPSGKWVALFQKCPGFVKTDLRCDLNNPHRFLTVDYWESLSDFSNMKRFIASEYASLDKECEGYTVAEKHIGVFEAAE